jgi:hypothetical protein
MSYRIVFWSAVGWVVLCLAPYVYALDDLITWLVHASVTKLPQERKIHENTLFLSRRRLKRPFEFSSCV